jgi:hypothetical protein
MKYIIFIVFFTVNFCLKGQIDTVFYKMKVVPIGYPEWQCQYGKDFEFDIKITKLSDSTFILNGLMEHEKYNIYFMKDSLQWHIKTAEKDTWVLFFNYNLNLRPMYTSWMETTVIWSADTTSPTKEFYRFRLKLPQGVVKNHESDYIFHPKFGVIGLKGDEFAFLKEDIIQLYFGQK